MTNTDKRKAQYREASKKNWKDKKAAGWQRMYIWIRPEWKKAIKDFIETLKDKEK